MEKMVLILFFFLFSGCKEGFEDDRFTIDKNPFNGIELRIDGYYYTGNGDNTTVIVLFQNGVILYAGSGRNLDGFEELFRGNDFVSGLKDNPFSWGLYEIKNDTISFEKYASYGSPKLYVYKTSALIEKDTTFHVFLRSRSDGTEKEKLDYSYYFKQFSPKPDSTNNIIK